MIAWSLRVTGCYSRLQMISVSAVSTVSTFRENELFGALAPLQVKDINDRNPYIPSSSFSEILTLSSPTRCADSAASNGWWVPWHGNRLSPCFMGGSGLDCLKSTPQIKPILAANCQVILWVQKCLSPTLSCDM